eukprot:15121715-Alexandrium_andersonii.AAC.1
MNTGPRSSRAARCAQVFAEIPNLPPTRATEGAGCREIANSDPQATNPQHAILGDRSARSQCVVRICS